MTKKINFPSYHYLYSSEISLSSLSLDDLLSVRELRLINIVLYQIIGWKKILHFDTGMKPDN